MSSELTVHPVAALFPMLVGDELQALADDIKANGLQQPVVVKDCVLLDGRNRLAACELAGVEPTFREYEGNDATAFIVSANLHRRHLSESQRAMIGARIANLPLGGYLYRSADLPTDSVSQSQAAELLNVSERGIREAKFIDREAPELAEKVLAGEVTIHAAKEAVRPHVANNAGDNEWYTPREYADAARVVMGGIDLDPASTQEANTAIGAASFFTKEQDGLAQAWAGRVWMNPPYAQPLIQDFSQKLIDEVDAGRVTEAIVLVNNATETAWFGALMSRAAAVCFPRGRVKFWKPGREAAPLQGQAVLYFGTNRDGFRDAFQGFGAGADTW